MFHIALPHGGFSGAAGPLCGMFSLAVLTGVAKSKDLNRALTSEERLPSRTATWDELGRVRQGKWLPRSGFLLLNSQCGK